MIKVDHITYQYPPGGASVLTDFCACFERGEIVAISGKNGCGKTTLTKLLAGILRPQKGHISIEGQDIANLDLFEIGQHVGYVFQNPARQLFCETVYLEIAFGLTNLGLDQESIAQKAGYYLDYFDLARYRDDYHGKLSQGEKQRLALAAVMALGTAYLVLDEPTAGLDMRRRQELGNILRQLRQGSGCGIVLVSHETDFIARYADRELVLT
jgi:energy-coupling factor transport system ATP-binding protein